jgi:hypothetical protein
MRKDIQIALRQPQQILIQTVKAQLSILQMILQFSFGFLPFCYHDPIDERRFRIEKGIKAAFGNAAFPGDFVNADIPEPAFLQHGKAFLDHAGFNACPFFRAERIHPADPPTKFLK